ncbi:MAG: hypothetical protein WAL59_20225, partial [Roseiarcus sp.]
MTNIAALNGDTGERGPPSLERSDCCSPSRGQIHVPLHQLGVFVMTLQALILILMKSSIFLNVFAIGLEASTSEAAYLFRRPGELVRAFFAVNVVMPLFAAILALVFNLNPAVEIALVALAISP